MKRLATELLSLTALVGLAVSPGIAQKDNRSVKSAQRYETSGLRQTNSVSKNAVEIPVARKFGKNRLSTSLDNRLPVSRNIFHAPEAGGELPEIYGSVIYSDNVYTARGLYQIPLAEGETFQLIIKRAIANYGGVYKDGVYYATNYVNDPTNPSTTVIGYNVETGEEVYNYYSASTVGPLVAMGLALDPITDDIYGIVYTEEVDGQMLAKIRYNKNPEWEKIADLPDTWNTFMIDADGTFYGIRKNYSIIDGGKYLTGSTLCRIDRESGAVTEIGETGRFPQYLSGGVIDPATGRMFWAVSDNENGFICEIDKTTGDASTLYNFPDADEVCGLYIPQPMAAPKAPGEVTEVRAEFAEGSLSGTVSCTAPATLFDGSSASGKMTLHVLANGREVTTKETNAGEKVTIPVTLSTPGFYNFQVYAQNPAGKGPKTKVEDFYIGADTPVATSVTLKADGNKMSVSWLPVTETVNNGYIVPADVVYNVTRFPDNKVVAKGIKETEFEETLETPERQTAYYYSVTAEYAGLLSQPAISNAVSLGVIVPPYQGSFDTEAGAAGFTIINANNDDYTWNQDLNYGFMKIRFNTTMAMDDWLITPPVRLKAGESYEISFPAYSSSRVNIERLEVKWGDAPAVDAMVNTAVEPMDIENSLSDDEVIVSAYVTAEEDGVYYFGIHGISPKDKSTLWVGAISISEPLSAAIPAMATDLKITPDSEGELKGTLTFKAPSVTMGGSPLKDLTLIEVLDSKEQVIKTFENPVPGEELSCEVTAEKAGTYTFSVVCSNSKGRGVAETVSSRIGLDKPAMPSNFIMTSKTGTGELSFVWDVVDTDCNGNKINPSLVTYSLFRIVSGEQVEIVSDLKETSYSYEAVPEGKQELVQCVVFAKTEAGFSSGALSEMLPVGTPYNGLTESFANARLSTIWGVNSEDRGYWNLYSDTVDLTAQDGDNGFLGMEASAEGEGGYIFSGLVSIKGMENPGLTFYTFNLMGEGGTPDNNIVRVYVREQGGEYTEVLAGSVQELCNSESGWGKVTVVLDAYKDKVIQVKIEAEAVNFANVLFDNIRIAPLLDRDLSALDINAPVSVAAGENFIVGVTVQNNGMKAVEKFTVNLYENGTLVETKEVSEILPEARMLVEFARTISPIATEPLSYYAEIVADNDQNLSDNRTATVTVAPRISNLPAIDDLEGKVEAGKVVLTWSEPSANAQKGKPVTEDFEDATAFADTYGDWIFVDEDGAPVGGFEQTGIPGVKPGVTMGSFWVWDNSIAGNETFGAHSGTKYLFALYRADQGETNDWAISPELDGCAQRISFYARSYDSDYPEKILIYYSTGSTDIADFKGIRKAGGEPGDEWTRYEVDLPEGAKRFAIRSCATDSFMLLIDDVTYIPAVKSDYDIMGYNIYRDGVRINKETVEENEYDDLLVKEETTYSYVVTALYSQGESKGSNMITILYSTNSIDGLSSEKASIAVRGNIVEVTNPASEMITIFTADGKTIYRSDRETSLGVSLAKGVYVVKVGALVKTVYVN